MVDKKPAKKKSKTRKKPVASKTSGTKKRTPKRTSKKSSKKAPSKPKKTQTEVIKPYNPKKGKRFKTGISKFDIIVILIGLRKQITARLEDDSITMLEACEVLSYLFRRLGKKSNHQVFRQFCFAQSKSFLDLTPIIGNWLKASNPEGGSDMAKIKLGITLKEILGMIPEMISEAWESYSDDKQFTADEGVILAAVVMEEMGKAADHEAVKAFFVSQGTALRDLAPLLISPDPEPTEDEGDGE